MNDQGLQDDKILAVPVGDPRFDGYKSISSPPAHILREIAYLFETYKGPEGKEVKVQGWVDANEAIETIEKCRQRFLEL
jgi:inorganic pyrophosphatase